MFNELEENKDWYNLSLLYRKNHMYKEEKKIIERGLQHNYDYFIKRQEWHDQPLFDRLVPRPALNLPVDPIKENLLDQTCVCTGADTQRAPLLWAWVLLFYRNGRSRKETGKEKKAQQSSTTRMSSITATSVH